MLSKAQVVKLRRILESQYNGLCNVLERQEYLKENKTTAFKEALVLENQPCKLSYSTINSAVSGETATEISQAVKLFIAPNLIIKEGSKLIITQNGKTDEYSQSGMPAIYETHQEIILKAFERWA